jgi:hypothetical protein
MIVTLDVSNEQLAALKAEAAAHGLTVESWLKEIVEQHLQATPTTSRTDQCPIWEVITERMKTVPPEVFERLPEDGASEHDHYLYGLPKSNS